MANYYTDHPEIEFHLNHPLMKRVVDLNERNYVEKDQFEDAPVNYEDAIENYKRLLDITGDVAANIIEPNSEDVDLEGPHLENGRMIYASKLLPMPVSRTSGRSRAVSIHSMSSVLRSSARSTSLASAQARP